MIDLKYKDGKIYIYYKDRYLTIPFQNTGYKEHPEGKEFFYKELKTKKVVETDIQEAQYERDLPIISNFLRKNPFKVDYSNLSHMVIDIEVDNRGGFPDPNKDKILSICYKIDNIVEVLIGNENDIILKFLDIVKKTNPDIIVGYNILNFDLKYIQKRSKKYGIIFNLDRFENGGRLILDMYRIMKLFQSIGVINYDKFSLSNVAKQELNLEKFPLDKEKIWEIYEKDIEKFKKYTITDVEITDGIYKKYKDLIFELVNLIQLPSSYLQEYPISRILEHYIIINAKNFLIPEMKNAVLYEKYKGAFVKTPKPGIYKNIAVIDFVSMYPSIIVSYNIDYYSFSKENGLDINGKKFIQHPKSLIPSLIERILDERISLKNMKSNDPKIKAKIQALKILANSFYGYLGLPTGRFYLREAAESVTYIGRELITKTIKKAEEHFQVIYADTDSLFLIYDDEQKVIEFVEKINSELPNKIKLDIEGFYKKAFFIEKRNEKIGAKKKYVLLDKNNNFKIRGFEIVRGDWSQIAKDTQIEVLKAILIDENYEKALDIIRTIISKLRNKEIPVEALVIENRLSKRLDEYKVKSPEYIAALKLKKMGIKFDKVEYVIVKGEGDISDRSEPYIENRQYDYDEDYYINHQVLPAVLPIFESLGYSKEELISKQNKLK